MKSDILVLAGLAASAYATSGDNSGCQRTFDGKFKITTSRDLSKRSKSDNDSCSDNGVLKMTLKDGILLDANGRTGSIASNNQFQFDGPAQDDALDTDGWQICDDFSLNLGDTATFFQCRSGDFYNLYNDETAEQCEPITIYAEPCDGFDGSDIPPPGLTVTQIGDGQIQVPTGTPSPRPPPRRPGPPAFPAPPSPPASPVPTPYKPSFVTPPSTPRPTPTPQPGPQPPTPQPEDPEVPPAPPAASSSSGFKNMPGNFAALVAFAWGAFFYM